ncbi:hypothetical protein F0A17_01770 [Billgrantia pellis]|uniref:Uncharacterized protein n=1 Tax=Billgrantia pellis TaxID=2606936 RepID=A0A7V7KHL1_9GAMM|nr:hypothetical protein [Halomonas pellis]KAA0014402.1 hypothetical protein F0A17_01770 [Halomonas pellis]
MTTDIEQLQARTRYLEARLVKAGEERRLAQVKCRELEARCQNLERELARLRNQADTADVLDRMGSSAEALAREIEGQQNNGGQS